jgi:hypothetical protein
MSGEELGRPKYTARPAAGGGGSVPPNVPAAPPGVEPDGRVRGQPTWKQPEPKPKPGSGSKPGLGPGSEPKLPKSKPKSKSNLKPKPKAEPKQPEQPQTVVVPLERRGRNWLWLLVRFVVLMVVRLLLTIVKVALWPFAHIVGHGLGD